MDPQQPIYVPPPQEPQAPAPVPTPSPVFPQYNAEMPPAPMSAPKKPSKALIVLLLAIFLSLAIGVGAGYMVWGRTKTTSKTTQQANTAGYTLFDDPNFTMQVPKDWSGDASYEPGQQLVYYYSPEDTNDENREKAAILTMYIGSQANRIDQQLESLAETAKYTTISDKTTEKDGVKRRIIEMTVSSNETPDNARHLISTTVTYGGVIINADIIGAHEYWQDLHAEDAKTIIESITPKCSVPKITQQESYSSTALLCE